MKISFKNKLHNCDKHLVQDQWNEEGYVVERLEYCSICGRVKNHISYGAYYVINYKDIPKIKKGKNIHSKRGTEK